jgi:hypothetical protein
VGVATFVSLPRLATALEKIPPGIPVHIKVDSLRHIDHACLHLLQSWTSLHEANAGLVSIDWERLQSRTYQTRRARRLQLKTGAADVATPPQDVIRTSKAAEPISSS